MSTTVLRALRSFVRAPVDPETYRSLLSLLVAFPLSVVYFAFLTAAVSTTLGLSVTLLGPVALLVMLLSGAGLAWADANLTAGLLGADIEPAFPDTDVSPVAFCKALLLTRTGWAALVYLGWRSLLGFASFVGLTVALSLAASLLLAPVYYDVPGVYFRPAEIAPDALPEAALAVPAGFLVLLCTLGVVRLLGGVSVSVAEALVGTGTDDERVEYADAGDGAA